MSQHQITLTDEDLRLILFSIGYTKGGIMTEPGEVEHDMFEAENFEGVADHIIHEWNHG